MKSAALFLLKFNKKVVFLSSKLHSYTGQSKILEINEECEFK